MLQLDRVTVGQRLRVRRRAGRLGQTPDGIEILGAAERALETAVREQPANWLPWMRLTDFRLFEQNDIKGAHEAVKVAIYLNPKSWDVTQRYFDVTRRLQTG